MASRPDGVVPIEQTRTTMTQLLLPGQSNNHGNAFGGQIMAWCDICAAVSAQRFCRGEVVTASMDQLVFRRPVRRGMVVILSAQVNRSWGTSMEVGVRVEREPPTCDEREHAATAYLTFVSVDEQGKPETVTQVDPETAEEIRRYQDAQTRRSFRLERRKALQANRASISTEED